MDKGGSAAQRVERREAWCYANKSVCPSVYMRTSVYDDTVTAPVKVPMVKPPGFVIGRVVWT